MKLLSNRGDQRVWDAVVAHLAAGSRLDAASSTLTLAAYSALAETMARVEAARIILAPGAENALCGNEADRPFRNRLELQHWTRQLAAWLASKAQVRSAPFPLPQSILAISRRETPATVLSGTCSLTSSGLGLAPGSGIDLVQMTESEEEARALAGWWEALWNGSVPADPASHLYFRMLEFLSRDTSPEEVAFCILRHTLSSTEAPLQEEALFRSAAGFQERVIGSPIRAEVKHGQRISG